MKIVLRNGLVYCSGLVLTGIAQCTPYKGYKLTSANKSERIDFDANDDQPFQQGKVTNGNIPCNPSLKNTVNRTQEKIDSTISTISSTTKALKQYNQYIDNNAQRKQQTTILNIRPAKKREHIQPVALVDKDVQDCATTVHQYIPKIKELNLIGILNEVQNKINIIVAILRKNNSDRLLTDAQKVALTIPTSKLINFTLKEEKAPHRLVVSFYNQTNQEIDSFRFKSKKEQEKYSKKLYKKAKNIRKWLQELINQTNNLINLLNIPSNDYNNNILAKVKRSKRS